MIETVTVKRFLQNYEGVYETDPETVVLADVDRVEHKSDFLGNPEAILMKDGSFFATDPDGGNAVRKALEANRAEEFFSRG